MNHCIFENESNADYFDKENYIDNNEVNLLWPNQLFQIVKKLLLLLRYSSGNSEIFAIKVNKMTCEHLELLRWKTNKRG